MLLVSVPYLSPLRRVLFPFKSKSWKQVSRARIDSERDGLQFFQYIYSRQEFEEILSKAGLRVIATRGYGILWGLYDVAFVEALVTKLTGGHLAGDASSPQPATATSEVPGTKRELNAGPFAPSLRRDSSARAIIKRLIVSEDDSVPLAGLGVRLMRQVCANMMMYVCERSEPIHR